MLRLGEPERAERVSSRVRTDPSGKRPTVADSLGGAAWPDEVRDWLEQLNQEATTLRAERRQLAAKVAALEHQLSEATSRQQRLSKRAADLERGMRRPPEQPGSREDWLTSVTDRTAHALRSGQEAAHRVVEQARQRAAQIEQSARQEAAEIQERAAAEARKIVMVAQYDAEGILQAAHASGEELLRHAARLRDEGLAELTQRQAALQAEIRRLEQARLALLESFAAIKESTESILKRESSDPAAVVHAPPLQHRLRDLIRRERRAVE
jgi:cell division septum initiation protein DivIVA